MWSVWLIFCDCGFHSVCPLMDEVKRLVEASCIMGIRKPTIVAGESISYSGIIPFFSSVPFSRSGLPVHHQLLELTQTHVRWVGDAIQPSHPLLSPSPPTFSLSQHQGLFKWVSSSHQVAKVLELQIQHHSFQRMFRPVSPLRKLP